MKPPKKPAKAPTAKASRVPRATASSSKASLAADSEVKKPSPQKSPPTVSAKGVTQQAPSTAPRSVSAKPSRAPLPLPKKPAPKPKQVPRKIPPILLEGDVTPAVKAKGPGSRYTLAPAAPVIPPVGSTVDQLPEAYGTRRLFLAARDPRWLYASWDLAPEDQRECNLRSRDGHLILKVFANDQSSPATPEVHLNPESRNWFVSVPYPETRYRAELGLYDRSGRWQSISTSQGTFTPPDAPAPQAPAIEFATIPVQVTFQQVVETVQDFVAEHRPLLETVIAAQEALKASPVHEVLVSEPARAQSPPPPAPAEMPRVETAKPSRSRNAPVRPDGSSNAHNVASALSAIPIQVHQEAAWTPEQSNALAQLIHIDSYRRVWMGSIEITELVRRQLEEEMASIAAAELARAAAPEKAGAFEFGISSRSDLGASPDRKFWFKVNAELIIYGATEPDAHVTIADRTVKLRPDGTFSFRFSLPDGRYQLPARARSADGADGREASLEFSRSTQYRGTVEPHPQDSSLKSPRPENL